jgi:hypothetical protein
MCRIRLSEGISKYQQLKKKSAATALNIVGKEVKPSIATVCVCALLLDVEHYNMFRPIWAIIR